MAASADPPGLDVRALQAHLREAIPGLLQGPLRAELISGGRSNLTYRLGDGVRRWVLRRPPLGHVLATAHDMGREFRVLRGLHGTPVPVPRPLLQGGPQILGAPFYVMDHVDGVVLRDRADLAAFSPAAARELAEELVDVLCRLHAIDPAAVGLADLGRPEGYLDRQLKRWERQLAASHTRELPELIRLGSRLAVKVPRSASASIVHGDYRLDNLVVDLTPPSGIPDDGEGAARPRVAAVLDWELATLGDPLADLASTVVWWDGLRGLDSPVAAVPGDVPGWADGSAVIAEYARRSGADLTRLPWYLAFAFYKIAVIFEGIHYRQRSGLTVGEGFDRLGALVPELTGRGHAALDSDRLDPAVTPLAGHGTARPQPPHPDLHG